MWKGVECPFKSKRVGGHKVIHNKYNSNPFISFFLHTYNQEFDQYPLALHSTYTTSSIQHVTTLDKMFYNGKHT